MAHDTRSDKSSPVDAAALARALRHRPALVEQRRDTTAHRVADTTVDDRGEAASRVTVGRLGRLHLALIHQRVRLIQRPLGRARRFFASVRHHRAHQDGLLLKTALDTNHIVVELDAMSGGHAEQQAHLDRLNIGLSEVSARLGSMAARIETLAVGQSLLLRQAHATSDVITVGAAATQGVIAEHGAETQGLIERHFNETRTMLSSVEMLAATSSRRLVIPIGDDLIVLAAMGLLVVDSADERAAASLAAYGDLELGTRLLIESYLSPGDTFIDVGANVGIHTLAGASSVGPSGRVVAIEPHPDTAQRLRRTVAMNGFDDRVTVVQAAASTATGTATLFLGPMSGHHSLLSGVNVREESSCMVPTATLDEIVGSVSGRVLVKIDVEGWEHQVADGARELFAHDEVAIIVEFGPSHLKRARVRPSDWFAAFQHYGFQHEAIDALTGTLRSVPRKELLAAESTNLFFTRKPTRDHRRRAV